MNVGYGLLMVTARPFATMAPSPRSPGPLHGSDSGRRKPAVRGCPSAAATLGPAPGGQRRLPLDRRAAARDLRPHRGGAAPGRGAGVVPDGDTGAAGALLRGPG